MLELINKQSKKIKIKYSIYRLMLINEYNILGQ